MINYYLVNINITTMKTLMKPVCVQECQLQPADYQTRSPGWCTSCIMCIVNYNYNYTIWTTITTIWITNYSIAILILAIAEIENLLYVFINCIIGIVDQGNNQVRTQVLWCLSNIIKQPQAKLQTHHCQLL